MREWGEENSGIPLSDYTREQAREYGLKHPSRVKPLRAMFFDAERDGLVPGNPFSALRIAKPRKERYFPSTEEVQDIIRAAQEPLRGRIWFAAYVGPRLGEVLAMRPCDLSEPDWRSEPPCRAHLRWQMNAANERVGIKGKLKGYWATVPDEARLGVAAAVDRTISDTDRLWPVTRAEHNKEWNALRRALKLPENFVWHSLRHHAATWFLDQGASFEDVAIQLGHSDNGQQVRDTYGHMSREKALDRLEAVVS